MRSSTGASAASTPSPAALRALGLGAGDVVAVLQKRADQPRPVPGRLEHGRDAGDHRQREQGVDQRGVVADHHEGLAGREVGGQRRALEADEAEQAHVADEPPVGPQQEDRAAPSLARERAGEVGDDRQEEAADHAAGDEEHEERRPGQQDAEEVRHLSRRD
jgi:hypothetical protein